MPDRNREVAPGPRAGTVRADSGEVLVVPAGWVLLPPGDPALTRRAKKSGVCWTVREKRGRRTISLGLYLEQSRIEPLRSELALERAAPAYERKLSRAREQRVVEQSQYEHDFLGAVMHFLSFAPVYVPLAESLARAITEHAVPVGSGTVARTKRIPIGRRAEAATIAWLRHATTGYDNMQIPRIKGARREVRRLLAERSRELLAKYRRGELISAERCLLRRALGPSGRTCSMES
jgi:hypothetical protein